MKSSISMTIRISDLDSLQHVNNRIYEQLCAENRHIFGEQPGLTTDRLFQLDTNKFLAARTYQYYKPIQAGQQVRICTWSGRIARNRV